jgi:hypothetical protein
MNTLDIAIENGGTGVWYGRIIELLGTHARSATRNGILSELRNELTYHLRWLRKHGEFPDILETQNLNIREEITGIGELGESGGEVALFDFDHQAVDEGLVSIAIKYMRYNRQELLSQCSNLNEEQMELVPSGKGRNISEILQHICNAEEFYVSRLGEEAERIYEHNLGMRVSEANALPIWTRLADVRTACVRTLEALLPQSKSMVFQRREYTEYPEEKWTAYKVLRRFLEHEREHIYNIREYLKSPIRPTRDGF